LKSKFDWRGQIKHLYLSGSIALFALGGFIAYMGNATGNPLVILLGFAGMAVGFLLFRAWRNRSEVRHIGKDKGGESGDGEIPNSLNLYPDKVEFAYVENPLGQSQKCLNDGKYYHVHKANILGELEEFKLPDDDDKERYYDPTEFANPVTMPSNKKYFVWSFSTMQKISVGVMALVIVGLIIGLVAMGG